MELNELIELSLDELKTLQQEVEDAIKNIIFTYHYEIGDILLQKTDYCVKVFKILDKDYDEDVIAWCMLDDIIPFKF